DIDVDFNACTSVVQAGNSGRFNLKPTLRASELALNALIAGNVVEGSLSGRLVFVPPSAQSRQPIPNATVWLEQQSKTVAAQGSTQPDTVEKFIASTLTDGNGRFEFCPVATGSYEIVADAASLPPTGASSNATVTTGIIVIQSGGPNNLVI